VSKISVAIHSPGGRTALAAGEHHGNLVVYAVAVLKQVTYPSQRLVLHETSLRPGRCRLPQRTVAAVAEGRVCLPQDRVP